ncbi:unnamed protein product [Prorocentrum cordatum]|uniref:Trafficking protein particle complex subunit 13 C-terminal domain-containing protein n=1 Tax=Prorocentrum cordatum TaxID=2364126 RepID=A0ABN9QKB7_9DINO|nr:unnamed protein product [Polarella glacialis]
MQDICAHSPRLIRFSTGARQLQEVLPLPCVAAVRGGPPRGAGRRGGLLVECTVENASQGGICLTSCRLDCADGLEATPLGAGAGENLSQFLKPRGGQSLTFRVAAAGEDPSAGFLRQLDFVGDLSLGWQVLDGPSGCVEGHQIRIRPEPPVSLDLRVRPVALEVRVEEPFCIEVEVANRAAKPAEPSLRFDLRLMGGIRLHGALVRAVGPLQPGATARVPLDLVVAIPGLHGLQGVSVVDECTQAKSEFGVLCDILAF